MDKWASRCSPFLTSFHIVLQGNGGQMNVWRHCQWRMVSLLLSLGAANPLPTYPSIFNQSTYGPANTSGVGIGPGAIMTFTGLTTNTAAQRAVL